MSSVRRVCVVGSGPAGFYAAQKMVKLMPDACVDILERLPVPFGLVRFGVAPDHPEVKLVINTFTKVATHKNVNFYGNITLGKDVTLQQLKSNYHAVLLAYGAQDDKLLGIQNEHVDNVVSAKDFVGWYNGSPYLQNFKIDLSGSSAAILGQGNVAMDIGRILLSPIDELRKTDITESALAALASSAIKNVYLIGRRGPLQAAFTIKELREMINIPSCETIWRNEDFQGVEGVVEKLERPRRRITELMLKSLKANRKMNCDRKFLPVFLRSPKRFLTSDSDKLIGIELAANDLVGDDAFNVYARETQHLETLECSTVFRSIGYRSVQVDPDINFDEKKGRVENVNGRVVSKAGENATLEIDGNPIDTGLYVTGWLKTGPTGVILTTMSNAFEVGSVICEDFNDRRNFLKDDVPKRGFDGVREILAKDNVQIVTWNDWEKIDEYEKEAGKASGKPREKLCDINKMLEICS